MNYDFPIIKHISQIIKEVKSDQYSIVNEDQFSVVYSNSISTPLLREVRGLIFDVSGNLIARPYHHAFHINQSPETDLQTLRRSKFKDLHVILEKLDGTTIYPAPTQYGYRLTTKQGITEASLNPEVYIADKPEYNDFINICLNKKFTPIFEWCSPKNKIILDYNTDNLILTGLRNVKTGVYCKYNYLRKLSTNFKLPCVEKKNIKISYFEEFIEEVENYTDREGLVIRFDNGHMIYFKSKDYLQKKI